MGTSQDDPVYLVLDEPPRSRVQPYAEKIVFVAAIEHADARHAFVLLRARRERPRRSAPKPRDERAPPSR
jgi:hypothetical protein